MGTESKNLTLADHLIELKRRLVKSLIAAGIAFIFTYTWSEELYLFLSKPVLQTLPPGQRFIAFTTVAEPFFIYLKIGAAAAVVLSSPYVIYQVWAFIAPGLYRHERIFLVPVVVASFFLFMAGIVFSYLVMFPLGFRYLLSFATPELRPFISMGIYFSFAIKMMIAFGVAFQLPLVILVLARVGMVSARTLLSYWRYVFVLCFVAGAVFTPPDVFSQVLLSVPLLVLYGLGVILAMIFGKKKEETA